MEATEIQPTAWGDIAVGTGGFLTTDAALSNGLTPLYDQAALDAAVAAERERCAQIVEGVQSMASTTNAVISVAKTAIHAGAWVWIFYALSEAAVNAACR